MKAFVLFMILFSVPAFAVDTRECPNSLVFEFSSLRVQKSLATIKKEAFLEEDVEVKSVQAALRAANGLASRQIFNLASAKNGKCIYYRTNAQDRQEKAEIYTSKGVNRAYFQSTLGPRGIMLRVYPSVLTVRSNGVALASSEGLAMMAIPRYPYDNYVAGGNLVAFGVVKGVKLGVREGAYIGGQRF